MPVKTNKHYLSFTLILLPISTMYLAGIRYISRLFIGARYRRNIDETYTRYIRDIAGKDCLKEEV